MKKIRETTMLLLAGALASATVAMAAPSPSSGASAGTGAAALVSQGEGDLMRGRALQERELQRRAQDDRKATSAASALAAPKKAEKPAPKAAGEWTFGSVTATNMITKQLDNPKKKDVAAAMDVLLDARGDSPEALLENAQKLMQDAGYLLYVPLADTVKTKPAEKKVDLTVDLGHIRSLTIEFPDNRKEGKYFSEAQIRRHYMKDLDANSVFNYNTLYDRFYQLNAHPDLTGSISLFAVDAQGNSVTNTADQLADAKIRQLAMRMAVQEKLPLHFVLDIDNNGTDASENWMGRATLQYLNLTQHDDVLTLNYQNSLKDIDALGGFAGSYYLPHSFGTSRDFALTLYGGWTDVNSEDVVDGIDVEGQGWFAGLQESATLLDTPKRQLKLSVGAIRRYVEDNLVVQGKKLEGNDVTVMPFTLALMYSDKKPDALKGMSFATLEVLTQFGDFLGTATEEEMQAQRMAADKDYTVLHLQAARLQMLPWLSLGTTNTYANPMIFARVNGQYASGALIPAEQFGLGGDGSVRGYASREYLGDHGVSGTLEFRLPIMLGLLDRKAGPQQAPWDRLQGVAFVDAGYVKIEDPLPGEEPDKTLYGAGVGARLALSDHFQVKCDLAFPLEKTADSDEMCVHFNMQVQF